MSEPRVAGAAFDRHQPALPCESVDRKPRADSRRLLTRDSSFHMRRAAAPAPDRFRPCATRRDRRPVRTSSPRGRAPQRRATAISIGELRDRPAPDVPMRAILFPISSNSVRVPSNAPASPQSLSASVPSRAPRCRLRTARRGCPRLLFSRFAIARSAADETVLIPMTSCPALSAGSIFATVASTSGVSGTMMNTTFSPRRCSGVGRNVRAVNGERASLLRRAIEDAQAMASVD